MRILTIALPTFDREQLLDRQLRWLSEAVRGYEDKLELYISDNSSPDGTPAVIERWKPAFRGLPLRVTRNASDIGAVRNIAQCIWAAKTPHVWVISDDDLIEAEAIPYVLEQIYARPETALMVLNFASRNFKTGTVNFEQCYRRERDQFEVDGRRLFGDLLIKDSGGVTLTTALVYRTDAAQAALASWPEGLDNLLLQLYASGFCATCGPARVTGRNFLTCSAGDHHFQADPAIQQKMVNVDLPVVYEKFLEMGYPRSLFFRMFLVKARRNARAGRILPFIRRIRLLLAQSLTQKRARRMSAASTRSEQRASASLRP